MARQEVRWALDLLWLICLLHPWPRRLLRLFGHLGFGVWVGGRVGGFGVVACAMGGPGWLVKHRSPGGYLDLPMDSHVASGEQ